MATDSRNKTPPERQSPGIASKDSVMPNSWWTSNVSNDPRLSNDPGWPRCSNSEELFVKPQSKSRKLKHGFEESQSPQSRRNYPNFAPLKRRALKKTKRIVHSVGDHEIFIPGKGPDLGSTMRLLRDCYKRTNFEETKDSTALHALSSTGSFDPRNNHSSQRRNITPENIEAVDTTLRQELDQVDRVQYSDGDAQSSGSLFDSRFSVSGESSQMTPNTVDSPSTEIKSGTKISTRKSIEINEHDSPSSLKRSPETYSTTSGKRPRLLVSENFEENSLETHFRDADPSILQQGNPVESVAEDGAHGTSPVSVPSTPSERLLTQPSRPPSRTATQSPSPLPIAATITKPLPFFGTRKHVNIPRFTERRTSAQDLKPAREESYLDIPHRANLFEMVSPSESLGPSEITLALDTDPKHAAEASITPIATPTSRPSARMEDLDHGPHPIGGGDTGSVDASNRSHAPRRVFSTNSDVRARHLIHSLRDEVGTQQSQSIESRTGSVDDIITRMIRYRKNLSQREQSPLHIASTPDIKESSARETITYVADSDPGPQLEHPISLQEDLKARHRLYLRLDRRHMQHIKPHVQQPTSHFAWTTDHLAPSPSIRDIAGDGSSSLDSGFFKSRSGSAIAALRAEGVRSGGSISNDSSSRSSVSSRTDYSKLSRTHIPMHNPVQAHEPDLSSDLHEQRRKPQLEHPPNQQNQHLNATASLLHSIDSSRASGLSVVEDSDPYQRYPASQRSVTPETQVAPYSTPYEKDACTTKGGGTTNDKVPFVTSDNFGEKRAPSDLGGSVSVSDGISTYRQPSPAASSNTSITPTTTAMPPKMDPVAQDRPPERFVSPRSISSNASPRVERGAATSSDPDHIERRGSQMRPLSKWTENQWREFSSCIQRGLEQENMQPAQLVGLYKVLQDSLPLEMRNMTLQEINERLVTWMGTTGNMEN